MLENNDYEYLVYLRVLVVGILPMLQYLIWKDNVRLYFDFDVVLVVEEVIFYPLAGYYLEHKWNGNKDSKHELSSVVRKVLYWGGNTTLGIMLLENPIRFYTEKIYYFFEPYLGSMLACMIWIFVCWLIGMLVTIIMKYIPLLRKIL